MSDEEKNASLQARGTSGVPIVRKALAVVKPQFELDINHGIHGVAHWSRVWGHGRAMAGEMDLNPDVLTWFAYLHDSRRENEEYDPEHGSRAADFALRLRKDRVITELSDLEFDMLCTAMSDHSDGHTEAEPTIRACWDSDRLDLARVGVIPDPQYLCTDYAKRPEVISEAVRRSMDCSQEEFAAVARAIGLRPLLAQALKAPRVFAP